MLIERIANPLRSRSREETNARSWKFALQLEEKGDVERREFHPIEKLPTLNVRHHGSGELSCRTFELNLEIHVLDLEHFVQERNAL